jgi:PEP-CTERM motif
MKALLASIVALFIAATFPTAALSVVTTDLSGFNFFSTCTEGPRDEQDWFGNVQPVNMYVTGLCPHHDDSYDPNFHKFETKISRFDGKLFDFLRVDFFQTNAQVHSSRGGFLDFDLVAGAIVPGEDRGSRFDFSGPAWSNLDWILLTYGYPDVGSADHYFWRFGNFTFDVNAVPEPAPLTLIGIALVGLAFIRRRAMSIA